jgi:hypothetical protein
MGPEKALQKVRTLAESASSADAPRLYQHAISVAKEMPAGKAAPAVSKLLSEAAVKAPKAVPDLADRVLESAVSGSMKETSRYTKALAGWSDLLSRGGEPYIANLGEFGTGVQRVQAYAEAARGQKIKAPKSVVESFQGKQGPRLRVKIDLSASMASEVPAVPGVLAESFGLPEMKGLALWEPLPAQTPLYSSFKLAPQAGPAAFYRAARARGASALASFWIAARGWLAARASGLYDRLRVLLAAVLRRLGFLPGPAGPSSSVEASSRTMEALRALPAEELAPAPERALKDDPYKLGYKLYPLAQ